MTYDPNRYDRLPPLRVQCNNPAAADAAERAVTKKEEALKAGREAAAAERLPHKPRRK